MCALFARNCEAFFTCSITAIIFKIAVYLMQQLHLLYATCQFVLVARFPKDICGD